MVNDDCIKAAGSIKAEESIMYQIKLSNAPWKVMKKKKHYELAWIAMENKLALEVKEKKKLRSSIQWKSKKEQALKVKISIYKRIESLIACDDGNIGRLFSNYIKNNRSANWLLKHCEMYVNGCYCPKSYTHDNFYRAALALILGGPALLDIMYSSGALMSTQSARHKLKELNNRNSHICIDELNENNLKQRLNEILLYCNNGVNIGHYKADEIYINPKLEVMENGDGDIIMVGICCEHRGNINCKIKEKKDIDLIKEEIMNEEVHPSTLVNVIQVSIQNNGSVKHNIVAIMNHCGKKSSFHKYWIGLLAKVRPDLSSLPPEIRPHRHFYLVSFTSDGCTQWMKAKKELLGESQCNINIPINFLPKKALNDLFVFLLLYIY